MEDLNRTEFVHEMWRRGDLSYYLWEQQQKIYDIIRELPRHVQTIVVLCARQFGKSVMGTVLYTEDCLNYPGSTVLVVGPTIKQTRAIVNPRMRTLMRDAPDGMIRFIKSEDRYEIGESELVLGGFDINNSSRQRGKTLLKIYIEEIVDSDPDAYLDFLRSDLGPALTHSKNAQIVFLTTPPKIPDHPFLLDTVVEAQRDDSFFRFTIDDNEALSDEQKAAAIRRAGGEHSVEARRELWCEIVRDTSIVVIPDFSKDKHVNRFPIPHRTRWHITIDWGGVRDFTCALLHTYDFFNNRYLILEEKVWQANTPTSEILEGIQPWIDAHGITEIHADVPGQLQVDLVEHCDFSLKLPPKDDWKAAVNNMAVYFSLGQIWISPDCTYLILCCNSGTFNKQKTDFARTNVLGHCDGLAALMYAIRVQDTENPYQNIIKGPMHSDGTFALPGTDDKIDVSTTIQPKRFGSFKK